MGRRKNQNSQLSQGSTGSNQPQKPTKSRFPDDGGEVGDATENSNVDVIMCDLEESGNAPSFEESFPDGDDKTSADYYFDSYSHFGNHMIAFFYIFVFAVISFMCILRINLLQSDIFPFFSFCLQEFMK